MRGRVVALYIMAFMGSTAIGGPLVGVAGELLGPRASLGVGAAGCAAGVLLAFVLASRASTRVGARPTVSEPPRPAATPLEGPQRLGR